jgi:ubiquinone/menaquinone biosynthesis C-methylase UbiE
LTEVNSSVRYHKSQHRFAQVWPGVYMSIFSKTKRVLEPEVMDTLEAAFVYDKVAKAHAFLDKSFVKKVLRYKIGEGKILDIGTGSGLIPIMIHKKNPHQQIYAIDLSENMLKIAQRNAKKEGLESKIKFLLGDGKKLQFEDHFFDMVVSHHTLHHIPDPAPVLHEMVRVVKKEGMIIIRDLKRPKTNAALKFYARVFGLIYNRLGEYAKIGKAQYRDSLNAAFTHEEIIEILNSSDLRNSIFRTKASLTHLTIELVNLRI